MTTEELLQPRYKVIAEVESKMYSVCDQGFVINNKTGRILKSYLNKKKKGYVYVKLQNGFIQLSVHVGNLVGKAFVRNPKNKPTVNHLDGNKQNNHYSNIGWATYQEQIDHAWKTGLAQKQYCRNRYTKKKEQEYNEYQKQKDAQIPT